MNISWFIFYWSCSQRTVPTHSYCWCWRSEVTHLRGVEFHLIVKSEVRCGGGSSEIQSGLVCGQLAGNGYKREQNVLWDSFISQINSQAVRESVWVHSLVLIWFWTPGSVDTFGLVSRQTDAAVVMLSFPHWTQRNQVKVELQPENIKSNASDATVHSGSSRPRMPRGCFTEPRLTVE